MCVRARARVRSCVRAWVWVGVHACVCVCVRVVCVKFGQYGPVRVRRSKYPLLLLL